MMDGFEDNCDLGSDLSDNEEINATVTSVSTESAHKYLHGMKNNGSYASSLSSSTKPGGPGSLSFFSSSSLKKPKDVIGSKGSSSIIIQNVKPKEIKNTVLNVLLDKIVSLP